VRGDAATRTLVRARSLDEALARVADGFRPLAGGTDVMVVFAAGKLAHERWVDLWALDELRGIEETPEALTLGALTTYTELQAHPTVESDFPMLRQAASETGGWAIQNRGTIGGNIANASPAADSPPALLAYGAEVELCSRAGRRWVPYAGFHTGYKQVVMRDDELIARVRLPRTQGLSVSYYRKVGPRRAQAISKICFAGDADLDGGLDGGKAVVRIALGAVAPVPLLCPRTSAAVAARDAAGALAALDAEIAPIDDLRSTSVYRRAVARNLLTEFIRQVDAAR
jgi:CO/xanthine dehydrogenase FAD-binding subunit